MRSRALTILSLLLLVAPALAQETKQADNEAQANSPENPLDAEKQKPIREGKQNREGKPESNTKAAKSQTPSGNAGGVSASEEAAVFAFVREHHPELGHLLKHLKAGKQPKQYERAMRDLYTVSSRINSLQTSDSARYELSLKGWKLKSRIQLLAAKLTMDNSEELKSELKKAISEQVDLRRDTLLLETQRLRERELKLSQELVDFEAQRDQTIERQYRQLLSTSKPKPNVKPKAEKNPNAKTPNVKTTGN